MTGTGRCTDPVWLSVFSDRTPAQAVRVFFVLRFDGKKCASYNEYVNTDKRRDEQ